MGLDTDLHKYNIKLTSFLLYPSKTFSYRDRITPNVYVLRDQNQQDQQLSEYAIETVWNLWSMNLKIINKNSYKVRNHNGLLMHIYIFRVKTSSRRLYRWFFLIIHNLEFASDVL